METSRNFNSLAGETLPTLRFFWKKIFWKPIFAFLLPRKQFNARIYGKLFFFSLILWGNGLLCAGTLTIDENSFSDVQYTDYSGTLTISATGFGVNSGQKLLLRNLYLKPGQTWESIQFATTGSVSILVEDQYGSKLYEGWMNTNQTVNLNGTSKGLNITLSFLGFEMDAITLTYNGDESISAYPNPFYPSNGNLSIRYSAPVDSYVTIEILDPNGKKVRSLKSGDLVAANLSPYLSEPWDGKTDSGRKAGSGAYIVYVNVKYLDSSAGSGYAASFKVLLLR